jgi:hypothetical protein
MYLFQDIYLFPLFTTSTALVSKLLPFKLHFKQAIPNTLKQKKNAINDLLMNNFFRSYHLTYFLHLFFKSLFSYIL